MIDWIRSFGHALSGVKVQKVQRVQRGRLTALRAEGCGIALSVDEYKVSITGLAVCVIGLDWHSADWLAALANPIRAAPDFPLCRGQNKAPLCCELLMKGLLCGSLLSYRSAGGKVVAPATKGGCISSPARAVVKVLYKLAPYINS